MTTPGVFSIVGNGSEPESISVPEIDALKRIIELRCMPVPWPYVLSGQKVCLESGPLQGVQGVVVDGSGGKWLVVSVELLQRSVAVKVSREFLRVKIIPANKAESKTPAS